MDIPSVLAIVVPAFWSNTEWKPIGKLRCWQPMPLSSWGVILENNQRTVISGGSSINYLRGKRPTIFGRHPEAVLCTWELPQGQVPCAVHLQEQRYERTSKPTDSWLARSLLQVWASVVRLINNCRKVPLSGAPLLSAVSHTSLPLITSPFLWSTETKHLKSAAALSARGLSLANPPAIYIFQA